MAEQMITVKQAAKILALSEPVVRNLCLRGTRYDGLDAIKINGHWRIPVSQLDRFIESRKGKA